MEILNKTEAGDISDKPDRVRDAKICHRATVLENKSINEKYPDELNTVLQATDYNEAESNVIKTKYKQKDNRYSM